MKSRFADSDQIKDYEKELSELCDAMAVDVPVFIADEASFMYPYNSMHQGIDQSAKAFALARLSATFDLDFRQFFISLLTQRL